jgi:hypothetical protein
MVTTRWWDHRPSFSETTSTPLHMNNEGQATDYGGSMIVAPSPPPVCLLSHSSGFQGILALGHLVRRQDHCSAWNHTTEYSHGLTSRSLSRRPP